ncbi:NAD(P)H-binding protein [Luteimonas sp. MJ246]|uniref:NAD(P)H-binding protein n=1 Tax=Luteimonas sp. MJ174 TaxID=3129237 RepID=UPI0031BA9C22
MNEGGGRDTATATGTGTGTPTGTRRVLVAGASGLVGRALVARLCADPGVAEVHALLRRPLPLSSPKLRLHVVDFSRLPPLPPLDEAFLALGTTIRVAGSRAAFRAVDFDANLAVARAALAAGATRIGLVSAMGADSGSRVFYSRSKGELEDALSALPLDALVIARPSLLLGDRDVLGQPRRRGEHLAAGLARWLRPLLPARLRGIAAEDVAAALADALPQARGRRIIGSADMQGAVRV